MPAPIGSKVTRIVLRDNPIGPSAVNFKDDDSGYVVLASRGDGFITLKKVGESQEGFPRDYLINNINQIFYTEPRVEDEV